MCRFMGGLGGGELVVGLTDEESWLWVWQRTVVRLEAEEWGRILGWRKL